MSRPCWPCFRALSSNSANKTVKPITLYGQLRRTKSHPYTATFLPTQRNLPQIPLDVRPGSQGQHHHSCDATPAQSWAARPPAALRGQHTNPGDQADTETLSSQLASSKGDEARPLPQEQDEPLGGTAGTAGEIGQDHGDRGPPPMNAAPPHHPNQGIIQNNRQGGMENPKPIGGGLRSASMPFQGQA